MQYSTDGGSTFTIFLYDGVNLIAEYNASGTLTDRYIDGTGTDNPLMWFRGTGTSDRRWLYTDYHGSVITYTGEGGSSGEIYRCGAYGEPRDVNNNENWSGLRLRYTGQMALTEARLYYYKARVYDPKYGRFLQTDPVGSKDDLDLYSYVADDPINHSDPTGLSCTGSGKTLDCHMDNTGGLEKTKTGRQEIKISTKPIQVR